MPVGVAGKLRVDVIRDEPEVCGRELPLARRAVRIAQRLELLEVRQLTHVDLLCEVAADRLLERVALREIATRKRPTPLERFPRSPPEEHLQRAVSHLQDDRERDVGGTGVPGGRLTHGFRPIVVNLSGKVRDEQIASTPRRPRTSLRCRLWWRW